MVAIDDVARLRALERAGLVDPTEAVFDRAARIASEMLGAPVALVVGVAADEQHFPGLHGLAFPWRETRRTPISHSFCRIVVETEDALSVPDSRRHPVFHDNPAIDDLGVAAYLGVPLRDDLDTVIGAVCAIDHEPRDWTDRDLACLRLLAEDVEEQLAVRLALADASILASEQRLATAALAASMREPGLASAAGTGTLRTLHPDLPPGVLRVLDGLDVQSRRMDHLSHALLQLLGRDEPVPDTVSLLELLMDVIPARRRLVRLGDRLAIDVPSDADVRTDIAMAAELVGLVLEHLEQRLGDGRLTITTCATDPCGLRIESTRPLEPGDLAAIDPTITTTDGVAPALRVARILADRLGARLVAGSTPSGSAIELHGLDAALADVIELRVAVEGG